MVEKKVVDIQGRWLSIKKENDENKEKITKDIIKTIIIIVTIAITITVLIIEVS